MKTKRRTGAGFTLVELLVVITVIGILSGISFKMWGMVTRNSKKADTIKILQCVAHALEEYRSEYGAYPPVDSVAYEHENPNDGSQTPWLNQHYFNEHPDIVGPKHGLVAYLCLRESGGRHNLPDRYPDNERDALAKKRWAGFMDGLVSGDSKFYDFQLADHGASAEMGYTNTVKTIRDGWDNEIRYVSKPPHQTYRLWSKGGDGTGEISVDKWDN